MMVQKLISITAGDLYAKGNYQDLQRYPEVDLAIAGDAEMTLPSLIEACEAHGQRRSQKGAAGPGRQTCRCAPESLGSGAHGSTTRTVPGFKPVHLGASISAASICMVSEIKNEDWSLVSDVGFASRWPMRLWSFDKHYQYIGGAGGAGVGYGAPASAGAALHEQKVRPDSPLSEHFKAMAI